MTFEIDTTVVRSIMALRGITSNQVAQMLQAKASSVSAWLAGQSNHGLDYVRQMEALDLLGVRGENLRHDVVHHWSVDEPLFGSAAKIYFPLKVLTDAFGPAQVAMLAPEEEPVFSTRARALYLLRFPGFFAVLEVRGHALLNFRFDPTAVEGLSWSEGSIGLLLEPAKYASIEPGSLTPDELQGHVSAIQDAMKWEQLSQAAAEVKITPDQIAALLKLLPAQLAMSQAQGDTQAPAAVPASAAGNHGPAVAPPATPAASAEPWVTTAAPQAAAVAHPQSPPPPPFPAAPSRTQPAPGAASFSFAARERH